MSSFTPNIYRFMLNIILLFQCENHFNRTLYQIYANFLSTAFDKNYLELKLPTINKIEMAVITRPVQLKNTILISWRRKWCCSYHVLIFWRFCHKTHSPANQPP